MRMAGSRLCTSPRGLEIGVYVLYAPEPRLIRHFSADG